MRGVARPTLINVVHHKGRYAAAAALVMPATIDDAGETATRRFVEFFAATIRNKEHAEAYYLAARQFFAWSEHHQIGGLDDIEPLHIAAYVEQLQAAMAKPSVK